MNLSLFNALINRFYENGKAKFYLLFVLSLIAGLFEFMGLILIYQFVLFLIKPDNQFCTKIVQFFSQSFNISDNSYIILILGISIALIYILKNIYILLFFKFSDSVLQDLNQKIIIKILKIFLFQDYLKINKITNSEKMNIVSKVSFVVWQYCYRFVNLVANSCVGLILIACLFAKFTYIAFFATLFISFLGFVEYKYLKKNSTYQDKHFSLYLSSFENMINKTINNIKEIRLNNLENECIEDVKKSSKKYIELNKNRNFYSILHVHLTEISIMMTFVLVLVLFFCTSNFDNKALMGSLCAICVIILRLTPVVNRAQSCLYFMNSNKCLVQELLEFDFKFSDFNISNSSEKMQFLNSIELKNVGFSYENDNGLKDINLKIDKNDFIGIVGKSGCYKTTLSLIIAGLFKAQKGEVLVDNILLNDINRKKWQNNIALLSQDFSILFEELDDKAKNICKKINDNCDNLTSASYGEKQRMALANILSTNKEVLILDEITSSSDVISQEKINNILEELKGKKTIITIAHRFQILKNCNKIIYMDNAKIIDIGTFKELSEKYEEFKKMIELSNFEI